MKKLLAVLLVTVLALSAFAGITMTGPTIVTALRGSATFGLKFNENGLDLFVSDGVEYKAYDKFSVSLDTIVEAGDASLIVTWDVSVGNSSWTGATLSDATYSDPMMDLYFGNFSFEDNWDSYVFANWDKDGNGVIDSPFGKRYMTVNLKDFGLDMVYVDLNEYNEGSSFVNGDAYAFKKSMDMSAFDLNAAAALWFGNARTTASNSATELGLGVHGGMIFKDALEGLTVDAAVGLKGSDFGFGVYAAYEKEMVLIEGFTGTLHAGVDFADLKGTLLFANSSAAYDAKEINGGYDFKGELDIAGTLEVYDTLTLDIVSSDLSSVFGAKYTNNVSDALNIYVHVKKSAGTDFVSPILLNAKFNGSVDADPVTVNYMAEINSIGNAMVNINNLKDVTKSYLPWFAEVKAKPMDKLSLSAKAYNYTTDPDTGKYDFIGELAKLKLKLTAAYAYNDIITLGAYAQNNTWGSFDAFTWYLYAQATVGF